MFMAKKWKPLRCPSTGGWLNELAYAHSGTLLGNEKEWMIDTHNNVDESQRH